MKEAKSDGKQGIGLYTYGQVKNSTPFQYFAQVVVGAVVASSGIMLGYAQYHSANRSIGGLVTSAVLIVIGIFFAHAGVSFWCKRLKG